MINEKKSNQIIYVDPKSDNVIIAKKGDKDSYTFYATKISPDKRVSDIDVDSLSSIPDIFDYLMENNINIEDLSKEMPSLGGKWHGK